MLLNFSDWTIVCNSPSIAIISLMGHCSLSCFTLVLTVAPSSLFSLSSLMLKELLTKVEEVNGALSVVFVSELTSLSSTDTMIIMIIILSVTNILSIPERFQLISISGQPRLGQITWSRAREAAIRGRTAHNQMSE